MKVISDRLFLNGYTVPLFNIVRNNSKITLQNEPPVSKDTLNPNRKVQQAVLDFWNSYVNSYQG